MTYNSNEYSSSLAGTKNWYLQTQQVIQATESFATVDVTQGGCSSDWSMTQKAPLLTLLHSLRDVQMLEGGQVAEGSRS